MNIRTHNKADAPNTAMALLFHSDRHGRSVGDLRRSAMCPPLLIGVLFASLVAGCSRPGDFGAFVITEITRYGGHTRTGAALPKVDARWTVKRDDNGFQASVTGTSFTSIDSLMHQAFGTPKMSVDGSGTATGQPGRVWGAVDIGVAIQLIGRPDGADIICVRGVRDMGEMLKRMEGKQ